MNNKEKFNMIINNENIGYGYVGNDLYVIDLNPKNIANFIANHQFDNKDITITTMFDKLICNTFGPFLNQCPNYEIRNQIVEILVPLQQSLSKPKEEVLEVPYNEFNEFYEEYNSIDYE